MLFLAMGDTADTLRWDLNIDEDYFAVCAGCKIKMTAAPEAQRARIICLLRFDKHPDGARGPT